MKLSNLFIPQRGLKNYDGFIKIENVLFRAKPLRLVLFLKVSNTLSLLILGCYQIDR